MFLKLYCDNKSKKYTTRSINHIKFLPESKMVNVSDAVVVVDTQTNAYGIFDKNDKLVPESLQYRGKNHQFIPRHVPQDAPYIDTDVIWVGRIYPHFGHFMVEHLNRLWGDNEKSHKTKYLFINNLGMDVQNFVYDFMAAYGVKPDDIIILNNSARFRTVYIPCQTLNISSAWISNKMSIGYRAMARNINGAGYDKVYMSRTKLPPGMRTIGEEKIQQIFEKNGYKIIYPETMTIAEQIAAVRDAKFLAGCAGTALHWALFMKPGGTVISLKRNSKQDNFVQTQYMFNTVSGLNSVFVWASKETHKSKHSSSYAPQIIGVTKYVKLFFDDFGFEYNDSDIAPDTESMHEYLAQYEKYKSEHGGNWYESVCRHAIKITSCLVPGRINRNRYRQWCKKQLHL